jgi:hypothetical protein
MPPLADSRGGDRDGDGGGGDDDQGDDDGFPSVDGLIGTFFSEASLWPVLLVMLASMGAFGAALLVLAGVDHNPFAMAALVLLAGMTLDVLIRSRRIDGLRNVARMIASVWGVAAGFAALAMWTGIAG